LHWSEEGSGDSVLREEDLDSGAGCNSNFGNDTAEGDLEGVPGFEKGDEALVEHKEPEAAGRKSCSARVLAMILSIVAIR